MGINEITIQPQNSFEVTVQDMSGPPGPPNGPRGATGIQGVQGEDGPTGPQGVVGVVSEVVYSGSVPSVGTDTTLVMAPYYTILSVECDTLDVRLRVYSDTTTRTTDAGRPLGTFPQPASGTFLEVRTKNGILHLSPAAVGYTNDLTSNVPVRIDQSTGSTITVVITIKYLSFNVE